MSFCKHCVKSTYFYKTVGAFFEGCAAYKIKDFLLGMVVKAMTFAGKTSWFLMLHAFNFRTHSNKF